ncbi:chitinase-like protein PB1E7.04c [Alosa sapidissima]|uniref:chitinase-like protein PB1E7.04c n=1 Tax=Alosa sapidissima TaxID=34773 RepID=UPI001C09843A|nr:chitinase-like protein PB1E7.04c [Alosa sapidissima]XP_041943393.1 chitinase-like protein PB1E7.04c [Alosa sapidissima]
MEGDPSGLSDGSSSGSAQGSPQEKTDLYALQEYILNLTEEDWMVFSSMLHTPMTRMQFTELCMAVMKIVSLSSITVILPAYVCVAKDVEALASRSSTPTTFSVMTSTERSPSSAPYRSSRATSPNSLVTDESSASSSSPEVAGGPVSELVRRMKGALATLRKSVYGSACTEATTVAQHGDTSHDLTCITTILEQLVSSGSIHQIARNLVSQVQGVLHDSSPTSIPVAAGKSVSDSVLYATVKRSPKRTLSASRLVYTYAEEAIKNLLQPYLLPLVTWKAGEDMASSKMSSSSYASSRPRSSLDPSRPNTATWDRDTTSPSRAFSEVADLFTRVMTFQVMDMVDSELKRHAQVRLSSPDKEKSVTEGEVPHLVDAVPGHYGGLFSGLIKRFLSELCYSESAPSNAEDNVRGTPSSPRSQSTRSGTASCESKSASQKLKNVLGLFTRLMVSQVMDIVQVESTVELEQPHSSASRPSSSKFSDQLTSLHSDAITDGDITACSSPVASVVGSGSSDNGCLVTVLMLRLLAKLRDQPTASADVMDSSRELIEKILSEFSSHSGSLNFYTYPGNVKIQAMYQTMDKFLLKEFGPEAVLQRAVETQDVSFDNILLTALRRELLPQGDAKATSVPSAAPSFEPVPGAANGQTAREKPKRRLNIKMPKLGSKKVSPTKVFSDFTGVSVETPAHHTPSVFSSGQRTRKRSFFSRMFTSQGSSEP